MVLAIIRLGLSFYGPYLLIHDFFSPLNLGLIGGTVNLLFWTVLLWLGFNVFAKKEWKKHRKQLVALAVLLTIVFSAKAILDYTRENRIGNAKLKRIQGAKLDVVKNNLLPNVHNKYGFIKATSPKGLKKSVSFPSLGIYKQFT